MMLAGMNLEIRKFFFYHRAVEPVGVEEEMHEL